MNLPKYEDYQKLIEDLARKHSRHSFLEPDEALSEANMCFVIARLSYDPERAAFSTYLYRAINQRLLNLKDGRRTANKLAAAADPLLEAVGCANPEREAAFRQAVSRLTDDAKEVIKIAFETPGDLIREVREEVNRRRAKNNQARKTVVITQRAIECRLRRLQGWTRRRVGLAMGDVKNALQSL